VANTNKEALRLEASQKEVSSISDAMQESTSSDSSWESESTHRKSLLNENSLLQGAVGSAILWLIMKGFHLALKYLFLTGIVKLFTLIYSE